MTLRTVLLSLQALLAAAEPDDPQDAVVANQVLCVCAMKNQDFMFLIQIKHCLIFYLFVPQPV